MFKHLFILTSILFLFSTKVYAHPGITDSQDCHYCTENCREWGLEPNEYHCHPGSQYNQKVLGEQIQKKKEESKPINSGISETGILTITGGIVWVAYKLFNN